MGNKELIISVDNRMISTFRETIEAFNLVSPDIGWRVSGGVGEDGNMVTLYQTEGATPMDCFTLGSLLFELHGTIFLDAYNTK